MVGAWAHRIAKYGVRSGPKVLELNCSWNICILTFNGYHKRWKPLKIGQFGVIRYMKKRVSILTFILTL